ncbi:hypothetical protein BL247_19975 [Ralstonia solanacearum]|nr:hypothetical protein BL247_19975 [Ralstonia solanacearum]
MDGSVTRHGVFVYRPSIYRVYIYCLYIYTGDSSRTAATLQMLVRMGPTLDFFLVPLRRCRAKLAQ